MDNLAKYPALYQENAPCGIIGDYGEGKWKHETNRAKGRVHLYLRTSSLQAKGGELMGNSELLDKCRELRELRNMAAELDNQIPD